MDTSGQKYPFPLSLIYPSKGNFIAVVGNRGSKGLVKEVTRTLRETHTIPVESASVPENLPGVGWSYH